MRSVGLRLPPRPSAEFAISIAGLVGPAVGLPRYGHFEQTKTHSLVSWVSGHGALGIVIARHQTSRDWNRRCGPETDQVS
jgi:hypothetical protein